MFGTITYLETGTTRQQHAYSILFDSKMMEILTDYSPILVGTIPINIDITGSDLDLLCCWNNKSRFVLLLQQSFSKYKSFRLTETIINNQETVIANFEIDDFEIEIFGQSIPVKQQAGYSHMIIEQYILEQKGEAFRQEVITLKKEGYKTEPAFAKLLDLQGDPYIELLKYPVSL